MDEQGFKRRRFTDWLEDMEDKTKEVFGDPVDTSELSPLGMILRLAAWHLGKGDERLEDVYNAASLGSSTGNSLYKLGGNDGLSLHLEEAATGVVSITGTPGYTLPAGFRAATASGLQFETTEAVTLSSEGTGTAAIEAVDSGSAGNVGTGAITVIVNPDAEVLSVVNSTETQGGRDRETDGDFRARILERKQNPGTSGNKADFLKWARELSNIGAAKVFPLWSGPGTVKVVVVDAEKLPAASLLVAEVQDYIDPVPGKGEGKAPIGANVTVASAVGRTINVEAALTLAAGYALQDVRDAFAARLESWRKDAAFQATYVSQAVIGALLLGTEGVLDYTSLKLNGGAGNVALADNEVSLIGTVDLEV